MYDGVILYLVTFESDFNEYWTQPVLPPLHFAYTQFALQTD